MRRTRWLPSLLTLAFAVVACSSSSSSRPGSPDASSDGASEAAASCGNIAACYGVTVTVDPTAPSTCGPGVYTAVSDYTSVTGDGPFTAGACSGQLSRCDMTLTCSGGAAWNYTFTASGFTATITQTVNGVTCNATAVGTRLPACPIATVDGGTGGGDDSGSADATVSDAGVDAGMEAAAPDGGGGDGGADSGGSAGEAGVDGGALDGSAEAGPPEAAAPDGGSDGSVADAGAQEGGDDGGGTDAGASDGGDAAVTD